MHVNYLATTALLAMPMVSAHGWVNSWVIDSVTYDGFVPNDPKRFPVTAERPTDNTDHEWAEPDSTNVTCGGQSAGEGLETWEVKGGSSVTANWISDDRLQPNMVWPKEHVGAIAEYMAECPTGDCNGVDATSLQWFKISEQGVDANGEWATDKLNRTRIWSFTIPEGIKTGSYLVRHELNAMHNPREPQIYPVCFQAKVTSEGTGVPGETVKFPNAYADFSQDFKEIDVWAEQKSAKAITYTPPGPRVATFGGAPAASVPSAQPTRDASASSVVSAPQSSVASDAPAPSADTASGTAGGDTQAPSTPEGTTPQPQATVAPSGGATTSAEVTPLSSSTKSHRGGRGSSRTRRPRTC